MLISSDVLGPGDAGAAKQLIISHSPWRLMWLGLCCVALAVALAPAADGVKIVGGLLFVYAVQGLIVEWLGIRVTPEAVAGPRRFASAPCCTLWRKRAALNGILDITGKPKSRGMERVVPRRVSPGDTMLMLFPNRETKLALFAAIRAFAPKTSIYRT